LTQTVLVTGANGFVAAQLLRSFAEEDVNLVLVVREGQESHVSALPKVQRLVSTGDLFAEDVTWWAEQCAGVDVVVHTAWYVEPGRYLESSRNIDCLIGSLNLAKGAVRAAVKRFVGIGTCFEYELNGKPLSVDSPLGPATPYAAAKSALYTALSQWFPACSLEFAWCRLFYLYGQGEDERRLVPYLRAKLIAGEEAELTSGRQVRDFLDVAKAGRMLADVTLGSQQGPINVCSGVPITVRQLAEQIADEYGRRDLLKFGARQDNLVDPPYVVGVPNLAKVV